MEAEGDITLNPKQVSVHIFVFCCFFIDLSDKFAVVFVKNFAQDVYTEFCLESLYRFCKHM